MVSFVHDPTHTNLKRDTEYHTSRTHKRVEKYHDSVIRRPPLRTSDLYVLQGIHMYIDLYIPTLRSKAVYVIGIYPKVVQSREGDESFHYVYIVPRRIMVFTTYILYIYNKI